MARILVLEDLEESFTLLKNVIAAEHSLVWVQTMGEAMTVYNNQFDLMLVDIRLEDGDGYQFCDWVRSKQQDYKTPIIFITASSTVESRITGFSVGGDDFISKPYNFVELKARIDAKLRRSASYTTKTLEFCGICIDPRAQQAQLRENMNFQNLDLTPIEFKILNLLLLEPEKVFTRDEILNRVWGADIYVYPRSVDTHVSKLRTKLGHKSMLIKSVHGTGYKLSEQDDIDSRENHKILAF